MTPENPETNTRNIEAAAKLKVVQQDDPSSGQQRYLRFDQLKWVGDRVNPRATRFVLITVALQLLGLVISAIFKLGPDSAGAITLAILTAFIVFALRRKNRLLQGLILFSILAGIVALWGDHWAVDIEGVLVYPDENKIWASPLYMPLAWVLVLTQLSYFAVFLTWKYAKPRLTILILAVAGALYIPLYEELAFHANWWYYQHTVMVSHTPIFVILAEGILVMALPIFLMTIYRPPEDFSDFKELRTGQMIRWFVLFGIVQGIWMNSVAIWGFTFCEDLVYIMCHKWGWEMGWCDDIQFPFLRNI